jgi:predicted ArsR family transcriptional regulator
MKTSRQQILELIEKQQLLTASEISRILHMTDANVRHHLTILEKRKEIQSAGIRPQTGKGRPAKVFSLSQKAKGNNYDLLCSALLNILLKQSPRQKKHILHQLSEIISGKIQAQINASSPLPQRLYDAIHHLNKFHYMARWEAHHSSPIIIFENCPYINIIDLHSELCKLDVLILTNLLRSPVYQTCKLEKDPRGVMHCQFKLEI